MGLTVTNNLTTLNACDSATGWTNLAPGSNPDTDILKENTGSVGIDTDIETNYMTLTISSTSFTSTTFYFYVLGLTAPSLDTWANGGIRVRLGDGTNTSIWYIGGKDSYAGGWRRFAFSTSSTPDEISGTLNLGAVTKWEMGFKGLAKSKLSANNFVDFIQYASDGTAMAVITDGASAPRDWQELLDSDDSGAPTTDPLSGCIRKEGAVFFLAGGIELGDTGGTNSCTFADTGQTLVTESTYRTFTTSNRMAAESLLSSGHYALDMRAHGSTTTSLTLGTKSGTVGIDGCSFISADTDAPLAFDFNDANVNDVKIYGSSFQNCGVISLPTSAANREVLSSTFNACSQVGADTCKIQFSNFVNAPGDAVQVLSASNNIDDCQFIACNVGASFEFDGSTSLDNWTFNGCTTDVDQEAIGDDESTYTTGQDGTTSMYSGSTVGVGQSFTSRMASDTLGHVDWYLKKTGSPTGTAVAKLWTITGSSGTTAVPNALQATSRSLDVSTLTGSYAFTRLRFPTAFTLANSTDYMVTLEYSGGDVSNSVDVGTDDTSPSAAGNYATYNGATWTADSTKDALHRVRSDGHLIVNLTNGSDATTVSEPNNGTVIINNAQTIELTGVTEGTSVTISDVDTSEIYAQSGAYTSDGAGAFKVSVALNYDGDRNILLRARNAGIPTAVLIDDNGTYTDETEDARSSI